MNSKHNVYLRKHYKKMLGKEPIGVGDGWFDILNCLFFQLKWDIDKNKYPNVTITCIKEKFGTLRVYAACNEIQHAAIRFAEALSAKICEDCGTFQDVKIRGDSWIRTLCSKCDKAFAKRRKEQFNAES